MKLNIGSFCSKLFLVSALILFLTVSGFVSTSTAQPLSLSFDESFVIGENTGADAKYFLASPDEIRTDSQRNIYIAEGQQKTIVMFSPQGKYLRSIGRSGSGPGEFSSTPIFNFDKENEIVTFDLEVSG